MENIPVPGQNIENKDWSKFIPLDKYWMVRMGTLDLANDSNYIEKFLDTQNDADLGGDVLTLKRVSKIWKTDQEVDVGEFGTLSRYLQFLSWLRGLNKKFTKGGTLVDRKVSNDPDIVNWDLKKLGTLDGGTTQWASAAILFRPSDEIEKELKDLPEIKYFLQMTIEAKKYWEEKRRQGIPWEPRQDELIARQAEYFVNRLNSKPASFIATNPDEYCFARAFELMSREEGEKRWPEAKHHESDRFEEMEKVIAQAQKGEPIDSKDHRVIHAMAMWGKVNKKELSFTPRGREAVNKTWPQFWDFINSVSSNESK